MRSCCDACSVLTILAAGSALEADPITLLHAAHDAGFDGVGLRLSHDRAGSPADRHAWRLRADDLGTVVHDVEVHRIGDGTSATPLLEAAVEMGARRVLVVSDLPSRSQTLDELAGIVAQATPFGIEIGIEYMAWTTPSQPLEAADLAAATGCVVVADVLHHHRVGAGPAELWAIVERGVLGWVQLCDAPATPPDSLVDEARHGRLPPGQGDLPIAALLAVVPDTTVLSVEVQSDALAALRVNARARLLHDATCAMLATLTAMRSRVDHTIPEVRLRVDE